MTSRFSPWLIEQMRQRRLGRNALARQSGVSAATITRVTLYGHVPRPTTIYALADFFGADRDTVLELAGVVQLSDLPQELPLEVKDLARRLYRLDPADREAILRQFDGILKLVEDRSPRHSAGGSPQHAEFAEPRPPR